MAEVTVMGAGIFGLSVAWECLRRGARVQVIDPGGPGAGASGGVVGALAPPVPENWNHKIPAMPGWAACSPLATRQHLIWRMTGHARRRTSGSAAPTGG